MWLTQDIDGAEHELALLNERWTLDGSRLQGTLSNERDMLWIWVLWLGLGDPSLVRSEVAFCLVSMATSFDPALGTSLVVVRVMDVVFVAFDGGDDVGNVEVLGVSITMLLKGSLDERREKQGYVCLRKETCRGTAAYTASFLGLWPILPAL